MISAHDVRRMKVCSLCGELGIYKPLSSEIDVPLVVCTNSLRSPGRVADFQHPTCYAGTDTAKLLLLPYAEREWIRVCDVTVEQMTEIVKIGKVK